MRRFTHEVFYQLAFAISLLVCTILSFTTMYKLECPLTDESVLNLTGKMGDYSKAYILIIILALIAGVVSQFVLFNKIGIIASGIAVAGVGLRFMSFADSTRGQTKIVESEGIVVNADVLDWIIGSPMALSDKFSGEFTATFYLYMIFAVASLAFAVMSALFINKDSFGY